MQILFTEILTLKQLKRSIVKLTSIFVQYQITYTIGMTYLYYMVYRLTLLKYTIYLIQKSLQEFKLLKAK